ncbi:hypothetical protein AVEN_134247-1 [Araneus ventricosus]|uniref:Uncharacterized protein n=1 Tax=Araneus ventricosus TaxID=182803 RepID=A0A4Y2M4Y2_ARAVE|nr:hypothetical protein AVEN_134247-1 [Araneus ventricosus]
MCAGVWRRSSSSDPIRKLATLLDSQKKGVRIDIFAATCYELLVGTGSVMTFQKKDQILFQAPSPMDSCKKRRV